MNANKKQVDLSTVRCQKCLQRGHWTYQCSNERKTLMRPSRTVLMKRKLKKLQERQNQPKIISQSVETRKRDKTSGSEGNQSSSSSSDSGESSDDSSSSSSSSSSTSSSSSSSESSSSSSSSESDSESSSSSNSPPRKKHRHGKRSR